MNSSLIKNKKWRKRKNFLLAACLYRRVVLKEYHSRHPELTYRQVKEQLAHKFTLEKLEEQFDFETHGKTNRSFNEMKKDNGYSLGKWGRDLFVSQMIEDVETGMFIKAEFLETPLQRLHNQKILNNIIYACKDEPFSHHIKWYVKELHKINQSFKKKKMNFSMII